MSLYSDYLKELGTSGIIEEDNGFATYNILGKECYLTQIYITPDARKTGLASKLADKVADIGISNGCQVMTGSVNTKIKDPTSSMKVLLAYGFKLLRSELGIIWFIKNI